MLTVVIPTLNAEPTLAKALAALVPAAVDGFVRQVVIVDGGSIDRTLDIADECGAEIVRGCKRGRGIQLAAGAARARFPWILFLHADTRLGAAWADEANRFIVDVELGRRRDTAAAYRFRLDDHGLAARALEWMVAVRCKLLRLPYGDQGLLISNALYREIGGFRDVPLMEDVALVRRLGRGRVTMFETAAITSAERYRRDGYARRVVRNQICLALFLLKAPMDRIVQFYGAGGDMPDRRALTTPPPAE